MAKMDDQTKLKSDAAEVTAKIVGSYEKLAGKFREKSQRAAERVKTAKGESKRAMHRRRFELYGDAAQDLDERVQAVRTRHEQSSE
ncbi:hypothetical protein [Methylobacterium planeticum]|uniref:Uncharacterized protein n=1 Tax=Methylobacterium planeticum TaxID=2615211 RepID=A0A6N6MSF0_9HYPH|nr:hypothetical protein [Methylobacterium planeticum]KAB1071537.1 hypothetical protein F6X51_19710 [Methylobacterium planeticum]